MKDSIFFPIILQFFGILIILLEFILPSMGILTVGAVCVFGYSLYVIYSSFPKEVLIIFVCLDMLMIPFFIWLGVKIIALSPLALKKNLSDSKNIEKENDELIGKTAITLTRLIPAGKIMVNNKRLDVVSTGDYIEKDKDVVIVSVNGNRIVVKSKQEN